MSVSLCYNATQNLSTII